jgi:hypothetical protein
MKESMLRTDRHWAAGGTDSRNAASIHILNSRRSNAPLIARSSHHESACPGRQTGRLAPVLDAGHVARVSGVHPSEAEADAIPRNTHTGRPLGAPDFVAGLEKALRRRLAPGKGGRFLKLEVDARQEALGFGER